MRISDWSSDVCSSDLDRGPELGMRLAEVAGIAERGIGQAGIERSVAIGAELLARRLHPRRPFVFGVAGGAGAGAFLAEHGCERPLDRHACPNGRPAIGKARGDRKSVVSGKSGDVRVALGVSRIIKKKKQ